MLLHLARHAQILSQTRDPQAVQPHLIKCFDAVKRLQFGEGEESKKMLALISAEAEKVPFSTPPVAEGPVESWLLAMQHNMCSTLYDNCKGCLIELGNASVPWMTEKPGVAGWDPIDRLDSWYFSFPAAAIIMIGQVEWTGGCTEALLAMEDGSNPNGMKDYQTGWINMIDYMVSIVRRQLTPNQRKVIGAKLTLDVHARDTNFEMIHKNISWVNDFDWQKQLRYYWEEEVDDCTLKQTNTYFRYGYEYLGNSMRLVVTPLTDKCYMTLTGGLNLGMGGAPAGPAGTGKTETTKDLAKVCKIDEPMSEHL
jgi:dynein heavy chain